VDDAPAGLVFDDLGEHRLKDLGRPLPLSALCPVSCARPSVADCTHSAVADWVERDVTAQQDGPVTVSVNIKRPPAPHAYCVPVVRELPLAPTNGCFDATW
jgi:hypothetical protein